MTFWVAGAVVVGAGINAYSANKAAGGQVDASNAANAESGRQYDQTRTDQLAQYDQQRTDQQPWMDAGKSALGTLSAGMGEGGQFTKKFGLADFAADPGYQFRLQQGTQGIQRAAAAHGGLYSGATLKALSRFNQDAASQEYGNGYTRFNNDQNTQVSRLQSLAGLGQSATNVIGQAGQNAYGTIASAGANSSNNISQNMIGAGNARASGYMGTANGITGGIGQYMNYTQNRNLLSSLQRNQGSMGSSGYYADNDYLTS